MNFSGRYRDRFATSTKREMDCGWRSNSIAPPASTLLAGLLGDHADLGGGLHWAIGLGDPDWPANARPGIPSTGRLVAELTRVPVSLDAIDFVDVDDSSTDGIPTDRIALSVRFGPFDEPTTLREFAVFAGRGSDQPGGGQMINYVVHEPTELEPGVALDRTLVLSLGGIETAVPVAHQQDDRIDWLPPERHPLGAAAVHAGEADLKLASEPEDAPAFDEQLDRLRQLAVVEADAPIPLETLARARPKPDYLDELAYQGRAIMLMHIAGELAALPPVVDAVDLVAFFAQPPGHWATQWAGAGVTLDDVERMRRQIMVAMGQFNWDHRADAQPPTQIGHLTGRLMGA